MPNRSFPRKPCVLAGLLALAVFASAGSAATAAPAPRRARPAVPVAAPARAPESPHLLIPAGHDSVSIESEAAPLIVPGRTETPDSLIRTPHKFALEQYSVGLAMEDAANYAGALLAYSNAVRADSTVAGANGRLGAMYIRFGRASQAEPLLRRELRNHPGDVDAGRNLGLVLSARGHHAEAITRLKRLSTRAPKDDQVWYALGVAYANAGRLHDAEAPLRRSIELSPDRALEHRDLGVVLASLNRPREAMDEYRKALTIDATDASIWLNIGNLEARAGRIDTSLVDYREAERRDSTSDVAYEAEIKVLTKLDARDAIADLYMRWVTAKPTDDDLRLRAVRHLAAIDRRDRALEVGRDGVRFDPRSASKRMILGLSLAAYGDTREAVTELRQAERLFTQARDRDKVRQLVASMRVAAPDSLREMFRADSVAHAAPGGLRPR